jgi:hypothetical protein
MIADRNFEELRNLAFFQVDLGCDIDQFTLTLSNLESCGPGSDKVNKSYTFDPNKKITKVKVIIGDLESKIIRINFYSGKLRLVKVGMNDLYVKVNSGRVESFEIASEEQLIGCKVSLEKKGYFEGMTWIKMQMKFRKQE